MTLSQHFINDHPERMIYIGLNIGYGNVVLTCVDKQEQKRYCLTDTGLLEVLAIDEDFLITAYPVSRNCAYAICRKVGLNYIPHAIDTAINRNKIHRIMLAEMEGLNLDDFE